MLKAWLLRFALRYLSDALPKLQEGGQIENWLVSTWTAPGFVSYFRERDKKIIAELIGGVGMKEQTREDYIRLIGQRIELLRLAHLAKSAFEAKQAKEKKTISTPRPN